MSFYKINDIDIENRRVIVRCDFNVPIDEFGNITNDLRITGALTTIKHCIDSNCKIVLMSHFGRPKDSNDIKYSLEVVAKRLSLLLSRTVLFCDEVTGAKATKMVNKLESGDILLLQNLRYDPREIQNSMELAKELSSFGEIYINDAFGVSHRKHSSVDRIVDYYKKGTFCAGFLLQKEVNYFRDAINEPKRPFCAIVGGSKVSSKLGALYELLTKVDSLIIGGAMAFTFLKAQGCEVGDSLVEDHLVDESKKIMNKAKELGVKLYLPVDFVVSDKCEEGSNISIKTYQDIDIGFMGLDIGPASINLFCRVLSDIKTLLWNGPMGVYEMISFSKGSFELAECVSKLSAITIIGGGDTSDMVTKAGYLDSMSFISTGGGASLMLLEGKVLPAIDRLKK